MRAAGPQRCATREGFSRKNRRNLRFPAEIVILILVPRAGASVLIVTYGRLFAECLRAGELLASRGIPVALLKLNRIRPVPQQSVQKSLAYRYVFFAEEAIAAGGVGEHFLRLLVEQGFSGKFHLNAVQDHFVAHACERRQMEQNGLDARSVADIITMECSH